MDTKRISREEEEESCLSTIGIGRLFDFFINFTQIEIYTITMQSQ
jgi:hypothetical protein